MANNMKQSKEARRAIYSYVETLLDRELSKRENIFLSKLVRKAILDQVQATSEELHKVIIINRNLLKRRYGCFNIRNLRNKIKKLEWIKKNS